MKALEGVRILDLTRMLPGPYATIILADLGAQVLKIEDPRSGDPTRWSPRHRINQNSTFDTINRGKQSLALNLKSEKGVAIFQRLLENADVVIEGFRPGVMDRLGIGYQTLRLLQPRVIFCSISGYGQDGPLRDRGGHDVNYLALAGVLGLQTDSAGTPVLSGIQVADLGGALFAVIGILAALAARDRTGKGQLVDVSMMDVGMALLPVAASRLFAGDPVPLGARLPLSGGLACYNIYGTADGRHLSIGALESKFWERFCQVIGREDFIPRQFDEGEAQYTMISAIRDILKTRTQSEWIDQFRQTDACVEPVLSLEEAFRTPQARHREMIVEAEHSSPGKAFQLGLPFKLSATPPGIPAPAPRLGEHTRQILSSHGYPGTEIEELVRSGVVGVS
jgi:crotonobetainyl-CoA:carnitine CoA-transferase CaiB-like acyl-CoA transferase